MTVQIPSPAIDEDFADAIARRIAAIVADAVYKRLRADVLMGDDALVEPEELAEIMHRHPDVTKIWDKIGVGPQFVRPAGSKRRQYRIGAIKHYLFEVKAGPMHVTPFLEAQARIERKHGQRQATE